MWKPGQIITIKRKRYRITKYPVGFDCDTCDHYGTYKRYEPCYTCTYNWRMPSNCYLKEIKPKSVMG
jgi:hypothetical protein